MPGGDRTGPMGMGPMTGRAAGYCAGSPVPGYMNNAAAGRGLGMRRGYGLEGSAFGGGGGHGGRGRRNRYYETGLTAWQRAAAVNPVAADGPQSAPAADNEQELAALRRQAELLGSSLKEIKHRIDALQAQDV